jgi:hypothetical protein
VAPERQEPQRAPVEEP